MKDEFVISIDNPCPASWSGMSACEGGRFCGACRKTVVDFTQMNADEITGYFRKDQSNVCGRFYGGQLHQSVKKTHRYAWMAPFYKYSMRVIGLVLGSLGVALAQSKNIDKKTPATDTIFHTTPGTPGSNLNVMIGQASLHYKVSDPLYVIDGVVGDSTSIKNLTPAMIESLDVIGDSAIAVARYGSKGKNGVIVVTTKRKRK